MKKKVEIAHHFDFTDELIGIVTDLQIHKLAWNINKFTGLQFSRCNDLVIDYSIKKQIPFNLYYFDDEARQTEFFIIRNKNLKRFLVPELKEFDYLVLIKGPGQKKAAQKFISKLNHIADFSALLKIDHSLIKNKQNLFFDKIADKLIIGKSEEENFEIFK